MKLKQKSVENYTFMLTFLCGIHKAQHCNTATAHNNLGEKKKKKLEIGPIQKWKCLPVSNDHAEIL